MAWWVRKQSLSKPGNFSYVLAANNPSGKKDNIYSGFVNEIHSNIPLSRGSIYEYYFIYHIFVLFFVLVDLFLVFLHTRKSKKLPRFVFVVFAAVVQLDNCLVLFETKTVSAWREPRHHSRSP